MVAALPMGPLGEVLYGTLLWGSSTDHIGHTITLVKTMPMLQNKSLPATDQIKSQGKRTRSLVVLPRNHKEEVTVLG